jgi:phosphoglycerate dehydrogenase-like enzyme
MKIAVLDDYQNVALSLADWEPLRKKGEVTVFTDHVDGLDAVAKRLAPFDVVCLMRERTPMPKALIEKLPNLKLIVTTGGRNRSIDVAAAKARGVTVCFTRAPASASQMVEFSWGMILSLIRHIPHEDRNMRTGGWQTRLGVLLHGKTLGLLGLGKLGTGVAKIGQAFGMSTIAWSQNLTADKAKEAGVRAVSKDELFSSSDVISVHLILSERSKGLVGAREFGLMKPTSYLVNTSRGPIVDEAALVSALKSKRIAGAALDVYDNEPLPPQHPLRSLDNVVITPHVGFVTEDAYRVYYGDTVEDVLAFLDGKPVRILEE